MHTLKTQSLRQSLQFPGSWFLMPLRSSLAADPESQRTKRSTSWYQSLVGEKARGQSPAQALRPNPSPWNQTAGPQLTLPWLKLGHGLIHALSVWILHPNTNKQKHREGAHGRISSTTHAEMWAKGKQLINKQIDWIYDDKVTYRWPHLKMSVCVWVCVCTRVCVLTNLSQAGRHRCGTPASASPVFAAASSSSPPQGWRWCGWSSFQACLYTLPQPVSSSLYRHTQTQISLWLLFCVCCIVCVNSAL